ncbi:MAG: hypothetical protein WC659_03010 [Patescibacteria group bacterium]
MNGEKRPEGGDCSRKELEGHLRTMMQDLILRINLMEGKLIELIEIEKYLKETVDLFLKIEEDYRTYREVGLSGEDEIELDNKFRDYKKRLQKLMRSYPSFRK